MAALRLTRYECEHELLPHVCARCGIPADTAARFALVTAGENLLMGTLIWVCPPLALYMSVVLDRRKSYAVPMCEVHRVSWVWRDRLITWVFGCLVVPLYLAAIAAVATIGVTGIDSVGLALLPMAYIVSVYLWLIVSLVLLARTVRTFGVKRHAIVLWGVHPDFIRALIADRVRTRELDPARLGSYGDVRDDFEEQWFQEPTPQAGSATERDGG